MDTYNYILNDVSKNLDISFLKIYNKCAIL